MKSGTEQKIIIFSLLGVISFFVFIDLVEADQNNKVNKITYHQLLDGDCIIDESISQFPIGWCQNDFPETGNEHYFILDEDVTNNSVITTTVPSDGICNIRAVVDNVGFLLRCIADPGSPLNYVVMNP